MRVIANLYYKKALLPYLLLPLAWLYGGIVKLRRKLYQANILKSKRLSVPVIIVGNITLGGTGKTPLVIALVNKLKNLGYYPGVVSRGYGSQAPKYPYIVIKTSTAKEAGDEPLLIHLATDVPVVIAANRPDAAKTLLKHFSCDVIISDDGLQHYAMQRDIEIIVLDGQRGLGNGFLFPAGPLRENKKRLSEVDFVVCNGVVCNGKKLYKNSFVMELQAEKIKNIMTQEIIKQDFFSNKKLIAIAGIGNPERFFLMLKQMGLHFQKQAMPDHYAYQQNDFSLNTEYYYLMTEKDAVKCRTIADTQLGKRLFYLPVSAKLEDGFCEQVVELLSINIL